LKNLLCEGKRIEIRLVEAGNVANSGAMGKFSNPPAGGRDLKLFNLCKRFFKGFL
jgi:hypothetical protein